MTKRYDPKHPYADASGYVDSPGNTGFPGGGVARNVAGAVGGLFSGGKSGRTPYKGAGAPNYNVGTNRATQQGAVQQRTPSAATVQPALNVNPSTGGLLPTPGSVDSAGRARGNTSSPGAAPSPRRMAWGGVNREWGGSRATNNAQPRGTGGLGKFSAPTYAAATPRVGPRMAGNVTASVQRVANTTAYTPQNAAERAAGPHSWGQIARDLGNAGHPGFAANKTGALPSTAAKRAVPQMLSKANALGPGRAALSRNQGRGGQGRKRAV